jgi:putative membrane protein
MEWIRERWPSLAIYIIYAVGLTGFLIPACRDLFAPMSWASLLFSFILLLYCHKEHTRRSWTSFLLIAAGGYFLEVIGVKTGLLFGEYSYGSSLGVKVLDTPLMIGVNWIMLVYLSSMIARRIFENPWLITGLAALLMTGLDVLIEPFAIRFDLWSWEAVHVPVQNYLMWFIISFLMNYIFLKMNPETENFLVRPLAVSMVLFFLLIDVLVIWL